MLKFKLIEKQVHLESSDAFDARIQNFFLKGGGGVGGPERYLSLRGNPRHISVIYIDTHIST